MRRRKRRRAQKRPATKFVVTAYTNQVVRLTRARSALTLNVFKREKKLGEMQLGYGSFYWFGHNWKRPIRLPWGRFADKMNDLRPR